MNFKKNKPLIVLTVLLLLLNVIDIVTTYYGLMSPHGIESNPLMGNNPIGIFNILVKTVLPLIAFAVCLIAFKYATKKEKIPFYIILILLVCFYIYVVGNNLIILKEIGFI